MSRKKESPLPQGVRKAVDKEVFIFLSVFLGLFCVLGTKMGLANMFNTMMNTAYALLTDTVFYIMGIAVLAGAVSALFSIFIRRSSLLTEFSLSSSFIEQTSGSL